MQIVSLPNPLLTPIWLAAICTGVLAVGAIVTAVFAFLAFRKQSAQVSLLQEQALQQAAERRRSRAALVYATAQFDPGLPMRPGSDRIATPRVAGVDLMVHNTGSQPVYDVRVHWVDAGKNSQAGAEDWLGTVPPGATHPARRDLPAGTEPGDFRPVVYFRDAAGLRWTLLADGHLAEVDPAVPAGAPAIATTAAANAQSAYPADDELDDTEASP